MHYVVVMFAKSVQEKHTQKKNIFSHLAKKHSPRDATSACEGSEGDADNMIHGAFSLLADGAVVKPCDK